MKDRVLIRGVRFLKDQSIDIRIRMLFFLEYAALFAGIIGTIVMLAFVSDLTVLIPNVVLIVICGVGIYLSHFKKKYDLSAALIVCGCAYVALPFMFFTSGGNQSGMPIWFLFGIIFICMMIRGKLRIIMPSICIVIAILCMLIGYYKPEFVVPLKNGQAEFLDMIQSFAIVSIVVFVCIYIYISAYDEQRQLLEKQSQELKKIMYTDALTGIANRHAYYNDSHEFAEGAYRENLVLVAMDVNGLKQVNDSLGHAAGDELIKNAAEIMVDAYSKYGNIYRTGGDEFVALLYCDDKDAAMIADIMNTTVKYTNEKNERNISIAVGVAVWKENKDKQYFELEKLADSIMYQNKSRYYRESGIDRRKNCKERVCSNVADSSCGSREET